jgi:hypothetical protein
VRRASLSLVGILLSLFPQSYRAEAASNETLVVALPDSQQANPQNAAVEKSAGDEPAEPSSLIQLLETRGEELILWAGIALTSFIIGWICGGNFYLRRERKRSRRLRF